jgi:hypothetical protein
VSLDDDAATQRTLDHVDPRSLDDVFVIVLRERGVARPSDASASETA